MWWISCMSKTKLPEVVETSGSFYSVYVRWLIPFRLLLPVVPVQPFANEVANNICRNRNKKSDYKICHRTSPPFCWRFGSLGIISHIFTLQNNFYVLFILNSFSILNLLLVILYFKRSIITWFHINHSVNYPRPKGHGLVTAQSY